MVSLKIPCFLMISPKIPWFILISLKIPWFIMISPKIPWFMMISPKIAWFMMISPKIPWFLMISQNPMVYDDFHQNPMVYHDFSIFSLGFGVTPKSSPRRAGLHQWPNASQHRGGYLKNETTLLNISMKHVVYKYVCDTWGQHTGEKNN